MERNKIYVGCCLIILNPSRNKVLIAKRKKEPDLGGWQIPGGTVDYSTGENIQDAVVREAFEETGLRINNPKFLCMMNTSYYGKERPLHIAFAGQSDTETIPPNPEPQKADDWHWVELADLPDGKWFRMSREALLFFKTAKDKPTPDNFVIDPDYPR